MKAKLCRVEREGSCQRGEELPGQSTGRKEDEADSDNSRCSRERPQQQQQQTSHHLDLKSSMVHVLVRIKTQSFMVSGSDPSMSLKSYIRSSILFTFTLSKLGVSSTVVVVVVVD